MQYWLTTFILGEGRPYRWLMVSLIIKSKIIWWRSTPTTNEFVIKSISIKHQAFKNYIKDYLCQTVTKLERIYVSYSKDHYDSYFEITIENVA